MARVDSQSNISKFGLPKSVKHTVEEEMLEQRPIMTTTSSYRQIANDELSKVAEFQTYCDLFGLEEK